MKHSIYYLRIVAATAKHTVTQGVILLTFIIAGMLINTQLYAQESFAEDDLYSAEDALYSQCISGINCCYYCSRGDNKGSKPTTTTPTKPAPAPTPTDGGNTGDTSDNGGNTGDTGDSTEPGTGGGNTTTSGGNRNNNGSSSSSSSSNSNSGSNSGNSGSNSGGGSNNGNQGGTTAPAPPKKPAPGSETTEKPYTPTTVIGDKPGPTDTGSTPVNPTHTEDRLLNTPVRSVTQGGTQYSVIPQSAHITSYAEFITSGYMHNNPFKNHSVCGTIAACFAGYQNSLITFKQKSFVYQEDPTYYGKAFTKLHFGSTTGGTTSFSKEGCYASTLLSSIARTYYRLTQKHLTVGQASYLIHVMRSSSLNPEHRESSIPGVNIDGYVYHTVAHPPMLRALEEICGDPCGSMKLQFNRIDEIGEVPLESLEPEYIIKHHLEDGMILKTQLIDSPYTHFVNVTKENGEFWISDPQSGEKVEAELYHKERKILSMRSVAIKVTPKAAENAGPTSTPTILRPNQAGVYTTR